MVARGAMRALRPIFSQKNIEKGREVEYSGDVVAGKWRKEMFIGEY